MSNSITNTLHETTPFEKASNYNRILWMQIMFIMGLFFTPFYLVYLFFRVRFWMETEERIEEIATSQGVEYKKPSIVLTICNAIIPWWSNAAIPIRMNRMLSETKLVRAYRVISFIEPVLTVGIILGLLFIAALLLPALLLRPELIIPLALGNSLIVMYGIIYLILYFTFYLSLILLETKIYRDMEGRL
jgi:hypothetical protein